MNGNLAEYEIQNSQHLEDMIKFSSGLSCWLETSAFSLIVAPVFPFWLLLSVFGVLQFHCDVLSCRSFLRYFVHLILARSLKNLRIYVFLLIPKNSQIIMSLSSVSPSSYFSPEIITDVESSWSFISLHLFHIFLHLSVLHSQCFLIFNSQFTDFFLHLCKLLLVYWAFS